MEKPDKTDVENSLGRDLTPREREGLRELLRRREQCEEVHRVILRAFFANLIWTMTLGIAGLLVAGLVTWLSKAGAT